MIFLGMNFFGDATSVSNFSPTNVQNITSITLQNGLYDDLYLERYNENYEIPDEWTENTYIHASFDNNTIGGNIDWYFDTISNILVKRKEENEQWVTIYNQPLETIDDFNFTYDDYLCANGKKFQYAIVTVEHDGTEGNYIYAINKDVDVELEELTITTDFEGITIVGQDEAYTTILEPGDCDTTRNQKVGVVELMYSSKPKVFVNSSVNYETGSTSGFFVKMDDNCQIDLKNSYAYRKEFIDFLTDGRPKFIKSWDGRCWLVMVSGNPTDTTSDHHDIRIIEFEWVEVGDTMSEKDLYEMGFINVSEEFWSNYYR